MTTVTGVTAPRFADRYRLEREIGSGATATVHLARDLVRGVPVAIKMLRPELVQSSSAERFLREILLTSRLQHPRVLPVLDAGELEGRPYFVLPYMADGTLRQRLERERQFPLDVAVRMTRAVADALAYAHALGVVHRDVKPENILFSGAEACLADFGIARALEKALEGSLDISTTTRDIIRGTPAYMSPEQASGSTLDGRSDVFSLGCVLYEMLAGVKAYDGPSQESIIAQRLTHPPRAVEIYRPSVPPALRDVLSRMLAIGAVDRLRADEAVRALGDPGIVRNEERVSAPMLSRPSRSVRVALGAAMLAVGTVATVVGTKVVRARLARATLATQLDTTQIVVFPLEREAGLVTSLSYADDAFHDALSRWSGIQLVDQFQVADVLRRMGTLTDGEKAARAAGALGAGRFIRGRLSRDASGWRAYAALYDQRSGQELFHYAQPIDSGANAAKSFAELAEALLLRSSTTVDSASSPITSRSVPAAQAFRQAKAAVNEWDLYTADSLFQSALGYAPEDAAANYWLAQIRAWQGRPVDDWRPLITRAVAFAGALGEREQRLARGMDLLGQGDYRTACQLYEKMLARNPRDFAAWYGLGDCHGLDRIVVADSRSPSGWRFRSSYRTAVAAYEHAFELLPSVHRAYERGAYGAILRLLLLSNDLRIGNSVGPAGQAFLARPGLVNDTVALIPFPTALVFRGGTESIPPGFATALSRQREIFHRIAATWATAFPRSASAKHALAIALQLAGDRGAVDTLEAARKLGVTSIKQRELAAREVLARLALGVPDDLASLRRARVLADSLLAGVESHATQEDSILAPLAALAGRCSVAHTLAGRTAPPSGTFAVATEVWHESAELTSDLALGCSTGNARGAITSLAAHILAQYRESTIAERRRVEGQMLTRPLLLADDVEPALMGRVGAREENSVLGSAAKLSAHDRARARRILQDVLAATPPELATTADVAFPAARLSLAVGDSNMAMAWLDRTITSSRMSYQHLNDPVTVAAFVRAVELRSEVSSARNERDEARRWARVVLALWDSSEVRIPASVRVAAH